MDQAKEVGPIPSHTHKECGELPVARGGTGSQGLHRQRLGRLSENRVKHQWRDDQHWLPLDTELEQDPTQHNLKFRGGVVGGYE